MIDIHAHILPRIDDGAKNMDMSVAMARIAVSDGITEMVATPHMLCDAGNPSMDDVLRALDALRCALHDQHIPLQLHAGGEIRVIPDVIQQLRNRVIPFYGAKPRYFLLEFPHVGDFSDALGDLIFQCQLNDIVPVLAHPERLRMFLQDQSDALIERSVAQGAVIQVTAGSLVEEQRNGMRGMLSHWLQQGWIHVIASDTHNAKTRPPVLSNARSIVVSVRGEEAAALLFDGNPRHILEGEDIEQLEPMTAYRTATSRRSFWQSLFRRRS